MELAAFYTRFDGAITGYVSKFQRVIEYLSRSEGLIELLGIRVDLSETSSSCELTIEPKHCGGPQVAHGGVVASLLDTALGLEAVRHAVMQERRTSTVEIKVNFMRPARLGATLVTRTRVESKGRSLMVISGTACDASSEEPVAFAVGTFNLYEPKS